MKKVLLVGAVIVLAIFMLIFFFILQSQSSGNLSNVPVSITPAPQLNSLPLNEDKKIHFSYPEDAEVSVFLVEPAGETDIIKLSEGVIIEVQKTPYAQTELEKMNAILEGLKLSRQDVFLGSGEIKGVQYAGSVELGENDLQQMVTLWVAGNTIYKMQLMYSAPASNMEYEAEYEKVISSIKVD